MARCSCALFLPHRAKSGRSEFWRATRTAAPRISSPRPNSSVMRCAASDESTPDAATSDISRSRVNAAISRLNPSASPKRTLPSCRAQHLIHLQHSASIPTESPHSINRTKSAVLTGRRSQESPHATAKHPMPIRKAARSDGGLLVSKSDILCQPFKPCGTKPRNAGEVLQASYRLFPPSADYLFCRHIAHPGKKQ